MTDTLPTGVAFVSAVPSQGTCTGTATVTCNLGNVLRGATPKVTIKVKPSSAGILSNTAAVSSSTADPTPGNNSATATTTVNPPSADVALTKTDSPDPVTAGTTLTYTITPTNNGPGKATAVTVVDTLPTGVTFVSAVPSQGTCSGTATVTCNLGNVAKLAAPKVTIKVKPSSAGTLSNTAKVSSTSSDPTAANDSATATTTVNPPSADVALTKTDSPDPVTVGTALTYTITAKNNGPGKATGVTVTDSLPAGVTFVSAVPSQGTCSGTATVTCDLGSVANLGAPKVTIKVKPSAAGTLTNSATVLTTSTDPTSGNDSATSTTTVQEAASSGQPNVLFIVTDDQRLDGTMEVMPRTKYWMQQGGTRFSQGFVSTPLCCPSRATIFTGRYAHNHGIRTLDGAMNIDQRYTIQRYLRQSGYLTGISGKFFNSWSTSADPPHFDKWAIYKSGYYDSTFNVNGTLKSVAQYSTNFIFDQAAQFIEGFESQDAKPWFMYVAPYAPHNPFTPEPAYAQASVSDWPANPAVSESDRSDKPPYVRKSSYSYTQGKADRRDQLRTLMTVDDQVERIFQQLGQLGEREDTLVVFMSDNGWLWGEHGLRGKSHAYTESIQVPFYMRWPGHVAAGATDSRMVMNVDLAPTVLDAAGISPDPALPMDGKSILGNQSRGRMLLESWVHAEAAEIPTWASTRTGKYQYIEYYASDGSITFREYYDLAADPWQLNNLLADGNPGNDPDVAALSAQLARDRKCEGTAGAQIPCP